MEEFGFEIVLCTVAFVLSWAAAEMTVMIATHEAEQRGGEE